MQQNDRVEFTAILQATYALYARDCSDMMLSMWWEAMRPYDLPAVRDALSRHCINPDNGQFPPKPADVVKLIGGGTKDGALIAWAQVDRAIRSVGSYQSVVFDDPIIHAVLADMGGWPALCSVETDEMPFRANEFAARYQGYRYRGGVTTWPPKLIGRADMGNASAGYADCSPVLIGDPVRAQAVLSGGRAAPLQITQAE